MIPGVPYDAEIEYLESTGTQWIDTGRNFGNTDRVLLSSSISKAGTASYWCFLGANSSSNEVLMWWHGGISYLNGKKISIPFQYNKHHIVDLTVTNRAASVSLDGVEYGTSTGKNNGKNIYLFGNITNQDYSVNTIGNFNYQRVYSCKLWQGQTLVHDLIPVRVGQTGYMYDRVTKRLFGNKGTGSFVLGPDVAKPVMGLWGMRKFYNTTDYVQDGLVAMWDGIDNTGHGHDPEATVWKDLVGDRDFTLNGAVVGQDNISWNGNYRSTSSHQPPNFVQMEILFRTISNYNWKVWFGDYGHSVASYYGAVLESKTARQDNSSYRFYTLAVSIPLVEPSESGKRWATKIYEKGVLKNISGNFNFVGTDWAANTMQLGGSNGLSLRCIRLYSHYLSQAEIAHNYQIDKARFNLP